MGRYLVIALIVGIFFPPLGIGIAVLVLIVALNGDRRRNGSARERRDADAWVREPAYWTPDLDRKA